MTINDFYIMRGPNQGRSTLRKFLLAIALAMVMGFVATPAESLIVDQTDWSIVQANLGSIVAGPNSTDFCDINNPCPSGFLANFEVTVYYNPLNPITLSELYTYEAVFKPRTINLVSSLISIDALLGIDPLAIITNPPTYLAGYDLAEGFINVGPGINGVIDTMPSDEIFTLDYDPFNQQLLWQINPVGDDTIWDGLDGRDQAITFWFTSTEGPNLGQYQLVNLEEGVTTNYGPFAAAVPEPRSLFLLANGLIFGAFWGAIGRKKRETK